MTNVPELTPEEEDLLKQALTNLQSYIKDNTTHYAFVADEEPTPEDLQEIEDEEIEFVDVEVVDD